jgi:hypothetical protein
MNRTAFALVVTLALLASSQAPAADVPVSYTVRDKELKNAVSGTDLTFSLYSDSACTNQIHSEVLDIDDVLASRLKLFAPPGGVKPPKTAELRATLTGVVGASNIFLMVTGTGVTAVGGVCQAQAAQGGPLPTCSDAITNQDETDVDCGGTICDECQSGESCLVATDCASGVCTANVCIGTCFDAEQNQDETDIDCGGSICTARCQPTQGCTVTSDCDLTHPFSVACIAGECTQHCADGQIDGSETDIDCGGACATIEGITCGAGSNCLVNGDCQSNVCTAGNCQP